ncbi:VCBS repeat-containing protein [Micromonospora sp. NPDC049559]|uniref:FG-GAP repeat domain-containing protein n=1 Tax=Micromonospora sp. NPDC049559 TaxID=3155923 RepID=UPI00343A341E
MAEKSARNWRRHLALVAALVVGSLGLHVSSAQAREAVSLLDCPTIPPVHDPAVIKTVHRLARVRAVSDKVMLAAFETGWVESHMNNLPCGDLDSVGVFQQRPSQGWGTREQIMNVEYATTKFLDAAIAVERRSPGLSAPQVAQEVQRSCCPEKYGQAEGIARNLIALAIRANAERISDWSGDGHADLLAVDPGGALWYYPNNQLRLSGRELLGEGWASFLHVKAADWSGDGFADVIAVDPAGDLWYYPHQGTGLAGRQRIGVGWQGFRHVMAADWSGDGHADIIGVTASGDLLYYPHQGDGLAAPERIGEGWGGFRHVMAADWSGDGFADVIAVDPAGDLWYYPHQGTGLAGRERIGTGWNTFQVVRAMDFSGDGFADIVAVDAAGDLWYYPHQGNGLDAGQHIGAGWGGFTHIL